MSIDIKAIRKAAEEEVLAEQTAKIKDAYKRQLRAVEAAKEVLRGEELKLQDLERKIQDGTLG